MRWEWLLGEPAPETALSEAHRGVAGRGGSPLAGEAWPRPAPPVNLSFMTRLLLAALAASATLALAAPASATCHSACQVKVVRGGASQPNPQVALAFQQQRQQAALERQRLLLDASTARRGFELEQAQLREARARALDAYELELRSIDAFSDPRLFDFDLFPDQFGVATVPPTQAFQTNTLSPGFGVGFGVGTGNIGTPGLVAPGAFGPLPATRPTPTGGFAPQALPQVLPRGRPSGSRGVARGH